MANDFEKSVAIDVLDALYEFVKDRIKIKGFDNVSVMTVVKRWDKVGVMLKGDSYHKKVQLYHMSGNLTPATQKRSKVMLDALGAFLQTLNNNGTTEGTYFNNAEKSVLEFVWEYKSAIKGSTTLITSEAAFKKMLIDWSSKSVADAMKDKELLTGQEAHL